MADTRQTAEDDERERERARERQRSEEQRQRQEQEAAQPPLTKAQQEAIANAPVVAVPQPEPPSEEVSEEQLAAQQAEAIANAPVVAVPEPPQPEPESEEGDTRPVPFGATETPPLRSGQASEGETDVTTVLPSEAETPPSVPRRRPN